MRLGRSILALTALAVWLLPATALAQGRRMGGKRPPARPARPAKAPKTPVDEFQQMSPEERQKALDRLPPEQRKKLEERLQKFNQLPPGQQQALKGMYDRLHRLPPERQEGVRQAINRFSKQPPERQQAMREELKDMAPLSAEERTARIQSPDFRGRFNHKEQEIVQEMSDLLPPL